VPSGAGRAVRNGKASTPCVGCRSITQPSFRITSTPVAGSGAGAGLFPRWPHPGGGASSSSRISTVAARPPPAGADTGGTVGAVVAVVMTTAVAVDSCCGSVATATLRGGSPVVAALLAARGALDEQRFVGTDASDLSVLADASAGTVGATLRTRKQKTELQPIEAGTSGGATAYLKVEKPRFLCFEGPADAAVALVAAAAALPDASVAHAGASAARTASSTDRPVAGASAPTTGACSSAASAALGDGVRDSTSLGEPAPYHSPLLPSPPPTTSSLGSPGERAPAARAAGTPRFVAPDATAAGCSSPSCAQLTPTLVAARRGLLLGPGAWAGQTVRHPQSRSAEERIVKIASVHHEGTKKGGKPTHRPGVGEHDERPELVVANGAPRPRGRILLWEAVMQQPRVRQRHRVGRLSHLVDAVDGENPST
jgi:hypothetical protein